MSWPCFPKSPGKHAIGQCWDEEVSADKTYEIFICPTQAEPLRVLDILLHEMIHACVGLKEGHKGTFRKLAKEFGLAGKMTATFAEEGGELWLKLSTMSTRLGVYPHAAMEAKGGLPKQPSHWVRFVSTNEDSYKIVANLKKVEEFGPPQDPWGDPMEPVNG